MKGGVIQLDFSATPRYSKGSLFTWTVFDYPLKQAILDNVTKRPIKGIAQGIKEVPSDIASVRYQSYLTAGVERWREYRAQLAPLNRKPVLFVMMNSTKEADDVADYLRAKYPGEFAGEKLLVIHTDRSGEVSQNDVEAARRASQDIDSGTSPINAIVSVLMLREGWDVQSARCGPVRQAPPAFSLFHPLHRLRGQSALLRAGFCGRHQRWGASPARNQKLLRPALTLHILIKKLQRTLHGRAEALAEVVVVIVVQKELPGQPLGL
jgi:hypothetical protein